MKAATADIDFYARFRKTISRKFIGLQAVVAHYSELTNLVSRNVNLFPRPPEINMVQTCQRWTKLICPTWNKVDDGHFKFFTNKCAPCSGKRSDIDGT
ncbi:hypothetical protein HI914_03143 [Erysiphe necator]|nr:hypothetical protein HI914_03143 [Erysiphe necator]